VTEDISLDDGMPLVGEDHGNRGLWIGLGAIGLGGILLFAAIEANRRPNTELQIPSPKDYAAATAPRSELTLPQDNNLDWPSTQNSVQPAAVPAPMPPQQPAVRLTRLRPSVEPVIPSPTIPTPQPYNPPLPPQNVLPDTKRDTAGRSAPAIVYDAIVAAAGNISSDTTTNQATKAIAVGGGDRTYVVSQGTLIFAVLETAIDSTQSGQVRAMLSTDVYNTSGTQILIAKGSRIFGEYKGELGSGEKRAKVIWTRLVRPDGATISLNSPASDQLGRAGVKGRVNSHFGERLLSALLQSTIDFGTAVASRAVTSNNGVVIALPASGQSGGSQIIQSPPKPTLKVRHGTRIAVFVARDLDFSAVE
jgi:type IV secretion system protein VirB10